MIVARALVWSILASFAMGCGVSDSQNEGTRVPPKEVGRADASEQNPVPLSSLPPQVRQVPPLAAAETLKGTARIVSVEERNYAVEFSLRNTSSKAVTAELGPMEGRDAEGRKMLMSNVGVSLVILQNGEWTEAGGSLTTDGDWQPVLRLEPGGSASVRIVLGAYPEDHARIKSGVQAGVELHFFEGSAQGAVGGDLVIPFSK